MQNHGELEAAIASCGLDRSFSFDIRPYASLADFRAGSWILAEGQRVTRLYYLIEGKVKLFVTHRNGRVSLVSFLTAPRFIGEMELLDPEGTARGIQAHTACRCIALDLARCEDRVLGDSRFLRSLCIDLGRSASGTTSQYTERQAYPLKNRLASYILLSEHGGVYSEKHTETAEYLGVSYRHLLYALAGLCRAGLLEHTDRVYRIRDRAGLEALRDEMLD